MRGLVLRDGGIFGAIGIQQVPATAIEQRSPRFLRPLVASEITHWASLLGVELARANGKRLRRHRADDRRPAIIRRELGQARMDRRAARSRGPHRGFRAFLSKPYA
jgi:hypothetical protein